VKISTKGHYAVQAMVDLTTQSNNFPIPLANISVRQEISLHYLEQLFVKLRKAGLVKSVRGPGGGYLLAKNPKEISIGAIFDAVDESILLSDCVGNSKSEEFFCSRTERCVTQLLWKQLSIKFNEVLFSLSLADVCEEEKEMCVKTSGLKHNYAFTI